MNIKVIGIGGGATWLLPPLCRFLRYQYSGSEVRITLIDGDSYEEENRARQCFSRLGNKAEVAVEDLRKQYPGLFFQSVPEYVSEDNVVRLVRENDVIFLCVDNHASRKLVSNRCGELDNVCLFSGGNEYTDGNIQIYWRKDGEDRTLPLDSEYHPEIANPEDKNPTELSCGEQAESSPQLILMNNAVATAKLNAFYAWLQGKLTYNELYLDILLGVYRPVLRQ